MTTKTYSPQDNNPSRTFILVFLVILGGFLFYFLGYGPLTKIMQAQSWSSVLTEVDSSTLSEGIVRTKDGLHKIYKVNIQYRYEYQGKWYKGSQYDFNRFYTADSNSLKNILVNYPVGKKFICFVNPKNPSESVIQRGLGWYLLPGVMPLLLIGVGMGGLYKQSRRDIEDKSITQDFSFPVNDQNGEVTLQRYNPHSASQNKIIIPPIATKSSQVHPFPK